MCAIGSDRLVMQCIQVESKIGEQDVIVPVGATVIDVTGDDDMLGEGSCLMVMVSVGETRKRKCTIVIDVRDDSSRNGSSSESKGIGRAWHQ